MPHKSTRTVEIAAPNKTPYQHGSPLWYGRRHCANQARTARAQFAADNETAEDISAANRALIESIFGAHF